MLGADLRAMTIDGLHSEMAVAVEQRRRLVIGHQNLHGLYLLQRDQAMRDFAGVTDVVFIDGMPTAKQEFTTINTLATGPGARPIVIGQHLDRTIAQPFAGGIDELYIFDTALTNEQIEHLARGTSPAPEKTLSPASPPDAEPQPAL